MQVDFQKLSLDHHLNTALQERGANACVFKWYLAIQAVDHTSYNDREYVNDVDDLQYLSINLPSFPKPCLYAEEKHYSQSDVFNSGLQDSKQPALGIHLLNCLLPQSLHWAPQEQIFTSELIENCPAHTQRAIKAHEQETLIMNSQQGAADKNQSFDDAHCVNNAKTEFLHTEEAMNNSYVETVLETVEHAKAWLA